MASNQPEIYQLLEAAAGRGASDLHLKTNRKPYLRIEGRLHPINTTVMTDAGISSAIKALAGDHPKYAIWEEKHCLDFSYQTSTNPPARFRVSLGRNAQGPYLIARHIKNDILRASKILYPFDVWKDIVSLEQGLVLVTGVTGSGKSTTLSSLIQEINDPEESQYSEKYPRPEPNSIITLEDPIETLHPEGQCLIYQKELGRHFETFGEGIRSALRQDPDVMLIGEIRDYETAFHALEAATTGHLVFSTLHTANAQDTVQRYVNLFPAVEQKGARDLLAANLSYVLCQKLIPFRGAGRTLAMEVLNAQSSAIKNHIRDGQDFRILGTMQTDRQRKSITMDQRLRELASGENPRITMDIARRYAYDRSQFDNPKQ